MAQKIIKTLVDDLTGEESADITTHSILIDGAGVEIDLTDVNYEELLEVLNPYLHAEGARRIRGAKPSKTRGSNSSSPQGDSVAIRAWAKDNGFEVNDRGRVPASIREAYAKAN